MSAEPAKDPPSAPVKRGKLITRDMTGVPTHPATGTHRVVNSCRGGHSETIEVHTREELHAAMVSGCRVVMPDGRPCRALVNVSRHINGAGVELGMIWIPDPKTPPDSDREAAR